MHPNFRSNHGQPQPESLDPARASLKSRLRLEVESSGLPHKAIAIGIGMDQGQFSRVLSDEHKDALHAHTLPMLTRELGPGLIEWLAVRCGGTYIHGAEPCRTEPPVVLIGLLAQQSGATVQQLIQQLEDHVWSPGECTRAIPGLRKLHNLVGDILHQAEEGGAH